MNKTARNKKITTKEIFLLFLFSLFLPNIAILCASWLSGAERSLVNIDYFIPLVLFSIGSRSFGILTFILFFSIDCFILTLQFFPFIKISDIIFLSGFILFGQTLYMIIIYSALVILAIKILILNRIGHKFRISEVFYTYSIFLFLTILSLFNFSLNTTLQINKYAQSYTIFLLKHHNDAFLNLTGENGKILVVSHFNSATQPWHSLLKEQKILPHRLLLVVNESWGFASDNKVQEAILAKLKAKSNSFAFFSEGHFFFSGATVGGEIRELCALKARSLDLRLVKTTDFSNCLPIQLKNRGYETYALHAALSDMYARHLWYPRIGFDHLTFFNNHPWPRQCHAFNGACDVDLTPVISQAFSGKNDLFFYWLTLNSHADYDERDIFSNRIDCLALEIDPTSESCRIIKLHAQFFDALSELISSPNMKNVEVIVAGDHPPPFFELRQNINTFKQGQVSWIHFKIK